MDLPARARRLPRALGATLLLLGLVGCTGGGTGTEGATSTASSTGGSAASDGASTEAPSALEVVPALDTPQEEDDRTLPESTPAGALPTIEDDTMRLLGEVGAARHYVALDRSGDICLITTLPGEDGVIGSTCGSPAEVDVHGLGLRVSAADAGAEAYLVPAGLDEASREEAAQTMQGTDPVHENLLAVTDEGSLDAEQTLDIARTDGGTFTLRRI